MKQKVNIHRKEMLYKQALINHLKNQGYSEFEAKWQADQLIKKMHIK